MSTATTLPNQSGQPGHPGRPRREWPYRVAVVALVLASMVVTSFPVVGTWYNDWKAAQHARQAVEQQSRSPLNAQWLAKARAYNAALPTNALSDPWTGRDESGNPQYRNYLAQLAETDTMASLRIPTIGVNLPIRHGTAERVLDQGAGHMYGTSLPVGGRGTHAALAAHRGLASMSAFDELPRLHEGDEFFIDVAGQTLAYRVSAVQVVLPNDLKPLARDPRRDEVTLITCTPYGVNSHRLLVTGQRVALHEVAQGVLEDRFVPRIQPWMRLRLGLTAAALVVLLALAVGWVHEDLRRARRRRERQARASHPVGAA